MIGMIASFALLLAGETVELQLAENAAGDEEVERARKNLLEKITEARSAGVVKMKNDEESSAAASESGEHRERLAYPAAPRLRNEFEGDCLTVASLRRAYSAASTDPIGYLDLKRSEIGESDQGDGLVALAEAYLVLGFYDEAISTLGTIETPRASAIAALSSIAIQSIEPHGIDPRDMVLCGSLYRSIDTIARFIKSASPEITDEELKAAGQLPDVLSSSVFDSISYAAINFDQLPIARLVEGARQANAAAVKPSVTAEFVHATIAAQAGDEGAREELLRQAAEPSREGRAALKQLTKHNFHASLNEEEQATFFDNLEDALSGVGGAMIDTTLTKALAERRLLSGDWKSAASLQIRIFKSHAPERRDAGRRLKEILEPLVLRGSEDEKFSASGFIFEHQDVLAKLLDAEVAREAQRQASAIGATDLVINYTEAMGDDRNDKVALAEALLVNGDVAEASKLKRKSVAEGRVDVIDERILLRAAADGALSTIDGDFVEAMPGRRRGDAAWLAQDWRRAETEYAAANRRKPDKETAERLLLAAVASERPISNDVEFSSIDAGKIAALRSMQRKAPSADVLGDVEAFAKGLSSEVDYIKGGLAR